MAVENVYITPNLYLNFNFNLKLKPLELTLNLKLWYNKIDPKWKERIARYGYRINVATALKEDLEEYAEIKIYVYIWKNFMDYILWMVF